MTTMNDAIRLKASKTETPGLTGLQVAQIEKYMAAGAAYAEALALVTSYAPRHETPAQAMNRILRKAAGR